MARAGDLFPGLRNRTQFGAVPVIPAMLALQAVSTATSIASLAMMPKPKTSYGAMCGCKPAPEPGPWCPYRRAASFGRQAAYLYGAAMRGERKANQRILKMRKGIRLGDPRAAAAAAKLDDAERSARLASRASKGDPKAARQIAQVFAKADSDVEASEAAAMLEVWLTDATCLSAADEMMDGQWDTDTDGWIVDEFSDAALATVLIDTQDYSWPT